ncbi:MAG TPA: hypothetical protein VJS64_02705 [Pyrinomonadaceae bacterium]|nr:hypothetical protein [Pyrinomonadaceae bacterium]
MNNLDNVEKAPVVDDQPSDWSVSNSPERIGSLLVAMAYLLVSPFLYPATSWSHLVTDIIMRILSLAFPLACIWFADDLAEFFQDGTLAPEITTRSSPALVKWGGWLLLLLPVLLFLFMRLLDYLYLG